MFNDKYGLTKAVLVGRKTMTRRIESSFRYNIGEVIAITQDYESILNDIRIPVEIRDKVDKQSQVVGSEAGWNNKMFVKADCMPHQLKITNRRREKLRDISDEDCLKEGIYKGKCGSIDTHFMDAYYFKGNIQPYCTPRDAFSELIEEVCGKGTWESNPDVTVYEFELIK